MRFTLRCALKPYYYKLLLSEFLRIEQTDLRG